MSEADGPGATGRSTPGAARSLRGLAAATAAAAVVVGLRLTVADHGPGALLLAVVLVLAIPVGTDLSQRALLLGSLVLGWTVTLWWWPIGFGDAGRVTVGLALIAAAIAGWVGAGQRPGRRLRQLVPRVEPVDAVPPAAVLAAAAVLLPWLRVRDGAAALSMLLPGWDNSAHFGMTEMLRRHGTTIDALGAAPGGETWKFGEYPQGFHAVVASVMELVTSARPSTIDGEVTGMVVATGVVAVLAVGVLTAGLCSLPGLRGRPAWASIAVAVVVSGLLLGPGAMTLPSGFANFFLAVVLTACVPLVAAAMDRPLSPVPLAALGGLLLGVAYTWVLLLSLALPAALLVVVPLRRRRWSADRRAWLVAGALVVLTAIGGAKAATVLSSLDASTVLTTQGGIATPDLGTIAVVVLGALGLFLLATAAAPPHDVDGRQARAALAGATTVVGLMVAAAIGALQIRAWSDVTYYFWKYVIGVELVALVLGVVAATVVIDRHLPRMSRRRPSVLAVGGTTLVVLATTQLFGFTGVPVGPVPIAPTAEGVVRRAALTVAASDPSPTAAELLAAALVSVPEGSHPVYLSVGSDTSVHPVQAQQWYLALTSRWTEEANDRTASLMPVDEGQTDVERALAVLSADPASVLLVGPDRLDLVRAGVGREADRVISW